LVADLEKVVVLVVRLGLHKYQLLMLQLVEQEPVAEQVVKEVVAQVAQVVPTLELQVVQVAQV
jgi:hypothetical protein